MSRYIVEICGSHDPLHLKTWLAVSNDAAPSLVHDRDRARLFETAEEARSVAEHYRESRRLSADFLIRQKRRAA